MMTRTTPCMLLLAAAAAILGGCRATPEAPEGARLPVEVREVPTRTMLVRSHVGPYSGAQENLEAFVRYAEEKGIVPTGDLMGVFFDDPSSVPPDRTRYDIRLPVDPGVATDGPYGLLNAEGHEAAMVLLVGSYEAISRRYGEVFAWIDENGYEPAGPLTEVYLRHPGSGVPADQYETEILVPVRRK